MDIIQELSQLKESFASANEAKLAVEAKVTDLTASLTSKEEELAKHAEAFAAKEAELAELKAVLASKEETLAAVEAKVADLTANQKAADEKAIEIVASQGIAPVKVSHNSESALTQAEACDEYERLRKENPIKAGEYFLTNSKVILGY